MNVLTFYTGVSVIIANIWITSGRPEIGCMWIIFGSVFLVVDFIQTKR